MSAPGLLRRRGVAPLLAAEIVSTSGSAMTALALPWLVLATTGSASQAGLVATAEFLPMALLGIPSGQLATRLGARRTMLACDLARAPLVGLVPLLDQLDELSIGVLIVIAFAIGSFFPAHFASQRTILPDLLGVNAGDVTRANVYLQAANRLPLVLGPALAGSLIAVIGASDVLVIDAASYLVSATLLALFVPRGAEPEPADEPGESGMWAGAGFLFGDRLLGPMTGAFTVLELAMQALLLSLPILAFTAYDERAGIAGGLLAAWGLGALVGTVPALGLAGREPLTLIRAGLFVEALPIWLVALDVPAALLAIPLAIAGLANPVVNAPSNTLVTLRAPVPLRAKAMLAFITLCMAAGGLGLLVTGPLAEQFGARAVIAGAAALATLGAIFFAFATRAPAGSDRARAGLR